MFALAVTGILKALKLSFFFVTPRSLLVTSAVSVTFAPDVAVALVPVDAHVDANVPAGADGNADVSTGDDADVSADAAADADVPADADISDGADVAALLTSPDKKNTGKPRCQPVS